VNVGAAGIAFIANAALAVVVVVAGSLAVTLTLYAVPAVVVPSIVAVRGEAVPVVVSGVPGKVPSSLESSTLNTLPAINEPVVLKATVIVLPTQTGFGVTVVAVVVCAMDETAVRSVIMQAKNPFLINVLFMYPSNIFSLTCSTGKVRDIF
jgi:hypothetical protein